MILSVGKVIYSLLTSNKELQKIIGRKVFPLIADSDTTFPFIVYKRNGIQVEESKDRYIHKETAVVEIIIAAEKYNESVTIAQMVKNILNNFRGKVDNFNVRDIYLIEGDEDYIENTFVQKLQFKIEI